MTKGPTFTADKHISFFYGLILKSIFYMLKPIKSVSMALMAAAITGMPLFAAPVEAHAEVAAVQQAGVVKGVIKDDAGQPAIGAVVFVVGTKNSATTDVDGTFTLKNVQKGATIRISLIGYKRQDVKWDGGALNVTLESLDNSFEEVVVTAMGIARKEKSLTYATQQIKNDEFMKVQDPNLVNSIEGKVSGVTITPSAGGAGGASKIILRGNKSIMGNNQPLIVVDGIPMTNNTRGQMDGSGDIAVLNSTAVSEGSDPLSQINPDDIESMNILKGANAAALYGSAAANGVVMITTKKGKEGKLDVNFTSNVTFDTPLLTPEIQDRYGAAINGTSIGMNSWGAALGNTNNHYTLRSADGKEVYLRDKAYDDISDFYRLGVTTNNSISLSGGTEKIRTYVSYANSHANGMIRTNNYNRNTFAFRQSYKFFNRVTIDVNANYVQTVTRNRTSGGKVLNPIYDLYTAPRNVDMRYYKDNYQGYGTWESNPQHGWCMDPTKGPNYVWGSKTYQLTGPMQQWAINNAGNNNPYWLTNMNQGKDKEDRFYGYFQGKVDIWDGLAFQARVSIDHTKFSHESHRYATTQLPSSMDDFGHYWLNNQKSNELYTDYLLSYNKTFGDWSVSATAGWVGHTRKTESISTDVVATQYDGQKKLLADDKVVINRFEANSGDKGATTKSEGSNWDKAALITAQVGWKDLIYVDGSYRRDWYRAFKQFSYMGTPDNYGYFGFGANAILSSLFKLPEWFSYAKYRLSYSEVGNSIPNSIYNLAVNNNVRGTTTLSGYNNFWPIPEKTKSFETGLEMQFFNNRLNADITYYNSAMHNSYLEISGTNGRTQPVNTGVIRNQGLELTLGYDWKITKDWRWKTSLNFSFNKNKIVETYRDEQGNPKMLTQSLAGVQIRYIEGGSYGDMYVSDFRRWQTDVYKYEVPDVNGGDPDIRFTPYPTADAAGNPLADGITTTQIHKAGDIYVNDEGKPSIDGSQAYVKPSGTFGNTPSNPYSKYIGNMNSKFQLGWSNTFYFKDFSLYFLINGRIGGKVISMTEGYLDALGQSQRTADVRMYAENNGIYADNGQLGMYVPDGSGQIVPIQTWYETVGQNNPADYVYNATNFRLRELSFGYTFRNLLGDGKNLTVSFIGRNLFFIYKDAPVDPDISLSNGNGLGAFEIFNLPSARSYGLNLKLNF